MGGERSAATRSWVRLHVRRVALLGVVAWAPMTVAVSDCSSTSASPAATCHLNSDCISPLICALGACRKECMTAADCIGLGAGSSCISDSKGNAICEPAAELNTPCDNESMCTPPLACASDYRCRNTCNADGDCNVDGITGRVCATDAKGAHYCADPNAVTNGTITEPPAGASDAASVPSAEAGPDAPNEGAAISGGACDLANPNSCPRPGMGCLAVDGTGGTGTTACGPVGTQMQGCGLHIRFRLRAWIRMRSDRHDVRAVLPSRHVSLRRGMFDLPRGSPGLRNRRSAVQRPQLRRVPLAGASTGSLSRL